MRGFLGAMSSVSDQMSRLSDQMARESGGQSYRPTYLKDEAGYVKSKHLLVEIYREVGMLGYAGMNGKVMEKAGSPPVRDKSVWREEWFGPSAARWAMQPAAKTRSGAAAAPSADVEWTDEELERQTRYFQELNDQRRAADEAAAAAAAAAGAVPAAEVLKYTPPSSQTAVALQDAACAEACHGGDGDGASRADGQDFAGTEGSGGALREEEAGAEGSDRGVNGTRGGVGPLPEPALERALEVLMQQHGVSHLRATLEAQEIVDMVTVAELSDGDWQEMGLPVEVLAPLVASARRALAQEDGAGQGAGDVGATDESRDGVVSSTPPVPLIDLSDDVGGWSDARDQGQTSAGIEAGPLLEGCVRDDRSDGTRVATWETDEGGDSAQGVNGDTGVAERRGSDGMAGAEEGDEDGVRGRCGVQDGVLDDGGLERGLVEESDVALGAEGADEGAFEGREEEEGVAGVARQEADGDGVRASGENAEREIGAGPEAV